MYLAVTHTRAKQVLEICDHMAIYFLIAGSYTPFTLVTLRAAHPAIAWTIFGIVWGLTVAGAIVKITTTGKLRFVSTLAYIGMGWIVVFAIKPLMACLPMAGLVWRLGWDRGSVQPQIKQILPSGGAGLLASFARVGQNLFPDGAQDLQEFAGWTPESPGNGQPPMLHQADELFEAHLALMT